MEASVDYSLCFICQSATVKEDIVCPLDGPHGSNFSFTSVLERLERFQQLHYVSEVSHPHLSLLMSAELVKNKGKWHKSCRKKFAQDKLMRIEEKFKKQEFDEPPRKKLSRTSFDNSMCIFCDACKDEPLHNMQTLGMDCKLRQMPSALQDDKTIARLCDGDVIALEVKYHLVCYITYVRRYERLKQPEETQPDFHVTAMEELISYMEEEVSSGNDFFALSELYKLYNDKLLNMNIAQSLQNKTRFKNSLLLRAAHLCLREEKRGRCVYLIGDHSMGEMLEEIMKKRKSPSEEYRILAEAASICRQESSDFIPPRYTGEFSVGCQVQSVPPGLLFLSRMLTSGPRVIEEPEPSQGALTCAQVLLFNMQSLHKREKIPELPLMTYLGLKVHSMTRSKKFITILRSIGVCLPYPKVIDIQNRIGDAVVHQISNEGVLCPRTLKRNVFTVAAGDNVDHNPSSTTSTESFHGTTISMFQPISNDQTTARGGSIIISENLEKTNRGITLPNEYSTVTPLGKKLTDKVPPLPQTCPGNENLLQQERFNEQSWLKTVADGITDSSREIEPWAVYHASKRQPEHVWIGALFPIFKHKSTDPSMIRHVLMLVQKSTHFLNPTQIPVVTFDQPLFAIAKQLQWTFPEQFGEDRFVVMLGGLHMEKALWTALGDILEGSGWKEAIMEAGYASSGTADSFIKAAHITRTRAVHQVSLAALDILLIDAFEKSGSSCQLQQWISEQKSPTFKFWSIVRDLEMLILLFVRAHRERNFDLYVRVLQELVPFFFITDHTNYARWGEIHIRDMTSVPLSVLTEFQKGNWVVSKTKHRFSSIPVDQCHEQLNKIVKQEGGVIGITRDQAAMDRWVLTSADISRSIIQFEEEIDKDRTRTEDIFHHEEKKSFKVSFAKHVADLTDVLNTRDNPFLDQTTDLISLDSKVCIGKEQGELVISLIDTAKAQYEAFQVAILQSGVATTIKKNKILFFKCKKTTHMKSVVQAAKQYKYEASLLGQLFIAAQTRKADLHEIFQHESQASPPSLSTDGKLYTGQKSDLLHEIIDKCHSATTYEESHTDYGAVPSNDSMPGSFDAVVWDGGHLIHGIPPKGSMVTFQEYASETFLPVIRRALRESSRVDIVWDEYRSDSLKAMTRVERGIGVRQLVRPFAKIPKNWNEFLRDTQNKMELFKFLSEQVRGMHIQVTKAVYATYGKGVIHVGEGPAMTDCTHEEADTRVIVHLLHAVNAEMKTVLIKTGDTDVVAILCGQYHRILQSSNIWIAFGSGKHQQNISLDMIYHALGPKQCLSMPLFHALTGCDTTSAFRNKGKKICFSTWTKNQWFSDVLIDLSTNPFRKITAESNEFKNIEKFISKLYSADGTSVNDVRRSMFCHITQDLRRLPPTRDALLHHCKRMIYQGGIWTQAHDAQVVLPSPEGYGWRKEASGTWSPLWITLDIIPSATKELIKCACKKVCTSCKCFNTSMPCTDLCKCMCSHRPV